METEQYTVGVAVVPGYYLVCYNPLVSKAVTCTAVVPGYYLVCYNQSISDAFNEGAVVPGYYLVCYNHRLQPPRSKQSVFLNHDVYFEHMLLMFFPFIFF